nr:MAG TPA: hypothetical protein [Caudoviricetes sp.]
MKRMTKEEFELLVTDLVMTKPAHNLNVEIGGEGKVVVLRWALTGSAERTEKKVLFASQSPVMINAALSSFKEWHKETEDYLYEQFCDHSDPDAAYERHLEDAGWMDAAHQDQMEAKFAPLDPQSGRYGEF